MDNCRMDNCNMNQRYMDQRRRDNHCTNRRIPENRPMEYLRSPKSCMDPRQPERSRMSQKQENSCKRKCPAETICPDRQTCPSSQIYWEDLPVGMAYIPSQKYCDTYPLSKGLEMGTIFPEMCKPFCGKGGGCH